MVRSSGAVRHSANALAVLVLMCAALIRVAEGAALSARVPAYGQSCYYTWVDQPREKVGFYFAVQEGGDFEVDYTVHSPYDKVILQAQKTSQEDYVFTANDVGEYSFCFENKASSHEDKLVRLNYFTDS